MRSAKYVAVVLALFLAAGSLWYFARRPDEPQYSTVNAVRREIRVGISTNGVIEPILKVETYAPVDGFVARILRQEGAGVERGQPLMELEPPQVRTALAEARAALLSARRQAEAVVSGPPREELSAIDGSIAECGLQCEQQKREMDTEKALVDKQAAPRAALENLQRQLEVLELRCKSLRQRREELLSRYSAQDKQWERSRVTELEREVALLEGQLRTASVAAPGSGVVYSMPAKAGAFVNKGQLLAEIYQPGKVRLRAYVDEPDLGRIAKGQPVRILWDGLPSQHWEGVVEKPAEQVVPLNNRSVGYVLCAVEGAPRELIPNLNVKVEIVTARKANALVLPRSAVYSENGHPAVLVPRDRGTMSRPVSTGLVTSEDVEILGGLEDNASVIVSH